MTNSPHPGCVSAACLAFVLGVASMAASVFAHILGHHRLTVDAFLCGLVLMVGGAITLTLLSPGNRSNHD